MKRTFKILSAILIALSVATFVSGLVFHVKFYWGFPVDEHGHGLGEVFDLYIMLVTYVLLIATAATVLPLLLVPRWRDVRHAVTVCAIAALLLVVHPPARAAVYHWGKPNPQAYAPKSGDIIFHTSTSDQSRAVQEATNSPFSHMGIIFVKDGAPMVFEAIGRTTLTPLTTWISRGEAGHYTVKRLRDAEKYLTPDGLQRMFEVGETFGNKPYDPCFEWSDDAIYCSELVWKIFFQTFGLRVGNLETLSDFDLSSPAVQAIIAKRNCRMDPDEVVISPKAIFEDQSLKTIHAE